MNLKQYPESLIIKQDLISENENIRLNLVNKP
jgi:hypothetical protein